MGMTWHSMWYNLVLMYQPVMRGSCVGRIARMFSEVVMAKSWDSVGIAVTARTHNAQEGASGWVQFSHWW
jgi:hypothetical protein